MENGTRLGPYEIVEQLGAGGMGEVYLAQDTRLGRKVAVKVLPEQFAADPERLARFEQEARAAAALNHPHIAAVYDVGAEKGDAGTTHFMVQEYLEGQSLRDLLERGPVDERKALALGTEIARALEAAHRAGVVHRDLKPENVFVTPDGHAKILDFGLAKLTEMATGPLDSQSMSPTVLGTQAGAIMGTAGYMAPEQVQGEEVDARADVFALGCVLWEMLTAQRAFAGKSVPHTLHKILDEEPEGHDAEAGRALPLRLRWLLDRTLAKDPEARAQSAGDVAAELRQIAAEVDSGTAIVEPGTAPTAESAGAPAGVSGRKAGIAAAVLVALGAVVGIAAFATWFAAPAVPAGQVVRFDFELPEDLRFGGLGRRFVAIAPDGSRIVFVDDTGGGRSGQLRMRLLDAPGSSPIPNTTGARAPTFSPDGQQILFWVEGQLKRIAIGGGAAIPVCSADNPYGTFWADDGRVYFGAGRQGVLRVSETGGEPEQLIEMQEDEAAHGPQLLPGGDWILFTMAVGSWNDGTIVAQNLDTGERRTLVEGGTDGRYLSTGHLVYHRDGTLFAVRFDAAAVEVTPGPVSLVEGVRGAFVTGAGQFAVSDTGTLTYISGALGVGGSIVPRNLVWSDRDGTAERLPFGERDYDRPAISPDGSRVAIEIFEGERENQLWILEIERGGSQRLTGAEAEGEPGAGVRNESPVWSPDGEWVYYTSGSYGEERILRRRADLSGPAEVVVESELSIDPTSVSSDGSRLLVHYNVTSPEGPDQSDIGIVMIGPEAEVIPLVTSPADEGDAVFSPDDRFVAFTTVQTGSPQVEVVELESGRRFPVSTTVGVEPLWSRDGSELFYVDFGDRNLYVVAVTGAPEFSVSAPRAVLRLSDGVDFDFDASPDGQRFLFVDSAAEADAEGGDRDAGRVNVVLNWFEDVKARAPVER